MQQKAAKLRAKKLGVLIYDARLASRRGIDECARTIGIEPQTFRAYESGEGSPSLPELEVLAYYLDVPIEHFWGSQSLSEKPPREEGLQKEKLIPLRQRMIGAILRHARLDANISLNELAQKTGLPEEEIKAYELGEKPISLPTLEMIVESFDGNLEEFIDKTGPVGAWRIQQQSVKRFGELPTDLQEFVCKPINRPYVELALRLSELSVERLRAIAEGILEITY